MALALAVTLATSCEREAGALAPRSWTLVANRQGEEVYGVNGTVVVAGDGASIELASIAFDRSGRSVVSSARSGRHWVRVRDSRFRWVPTTVELGAAPVVPVELLPGTAVRVTVLGENGEPLAGASVSVWCAGTDPLEFDLLEPGAMIGPIPAGDGKLVARAPGHAARVLSVLVPRLRPGKETKLPPVVLSRGGASLTGRIAGGAADRVVLLFGGAGLAAAPAPDGTFFFHGIPVERDPVLVIERDGRELFAEPVRLSSGSVDLGELSLD